MTPNPILEELYSTREKLLADAGGDIRKYLAGVREREALSGRLIGAKVQRKPVDIEHSNPLRKSV